MEEYYQQTIEELVLNESFRNLILHPTGRQQTQFEQWLEAHPAESQKLMAAADLVRAVRIENNALSPVDHAEAVERIFDLTSRKKETAKLRPLYYWAFGAAATLAVIIGFYMIPSQKQAGFASAQQSQQGADREWIVNNTPRSKLIQLADGSTVFLKPGGAVRYPANFGPDRRDVELRGEAFFEVAPDKSKPFYVSAGGTITKVLGTSFSVRALNAESETVVAVVSGKVNVSRADQDTPGQSVQVTPGQQVTVGKKNRNVLKATQASDDEISAFLRSAADGKNIQVVHYLEIARKAYDIDISFDPKQLKTCKIRANFQGMHLMEQIDAICKAINANYTLGNGGIQIKSPGC
ncbi:FecR family protein [Dyadobacter sp. Leaf189]|uniref:FecR family protein n=1 Tax=Dyadobacter sp. Leaf189 TaxID=1736295 RepID=UPI0006F820BB|nr:FecR domain-containing protein [Dyadobacter sp. Leaf189]KQS27869.1 hypothetical protein ASG33_15755 [Dyadobacter sp. Leaf189]